MKYFTSLLGAVAGLALAAQAQAQDHAQDHAQDQIESHFSDGKVYINLGHSYSIPALTLKNNTTELKYKAGYKKGAHNALIRAGYNMGVFGFELEASLNNDTLRLEHNNPTAVGSAQDPSKPHMVTKYKLPYQLGAFATASFPASKYIDLHGRIGGLFGRANIETFMEREYTHSGTKHYFVDQAYQPFTMKQNLISLALGAGGVYKFDELNGIRFDYTYQISRKLKSKHKGLESTARIQGHNLSVAYVRKF